MTTLVLVHGAWSSAALWGRVPALLAAQGHEVVVPDLPGHRAETRPRGDVGLAEAAQQVLAVLPPAPAVLVGHSMGGMVISAVAEAAPERVARLIYVAAFLPRDGDSLLRLKKREGQTIGPAVRKGREPGTTELDPALAAPILFQDAAPEDQAAALAKLRPQSNAVQTDRVHLSEARFGRVPRSYILCTQDRTITPELQRTMATETPCDTVVELAAGHFPQLSAADALAARIAALADPTAGTMPRGTETGARREGSP